MDYQKMTMVVARYNENLDWLKEVPWKYIVFNKGTDNLPKWIKNKVKLENIGREAHTYLTYILDNYDKLPAYTIFLQGNPFDHAKKLINRINDFNGGHDFFTLSDKIFYSDGNGYPKHPGLPLSKSAQKIFMDEIGSFEYPAGAEFIISKKAIRFHTKITYQKIMDFMADGKPSNERYSIMRGKRYIRSTNLFSAWVMERLWKTLFDNKHKTIYD